MKILKYLCLLLFTLLFACQSPKADQAYQAEIDQWHQQRIENLKKPEGWFSLAGLFWLKEGDNTFGSSEDNELIFPETFPAKTGVFHLENNQVTVSINNGMGVLIDGKPMLKATLKHDQEENTTRMTWKSYIWYVIKRGDRFGIRLKDTLNPARLQFNGIERFPVNEKYRISAKFIPYDPPREIVIPTIIGTDDIEESPGALEFELDGKKLTLDPIGKPGDKSWFIVFGDATNGKETYGAGRFLVIPAPDSTGTVILDFNRAYNPPCAFTPYATCPLPPEQNFLPVAIKAGEKNYGDGHH
ncbi:MAG: DUF1684 domain-containing protein [Calditrichia bacterium]